MSKLFKYRGINVFIIKFIVKNEVIERRHLGPGFLHYSNEETKFNTEATFLLSKILKFQLEDGNFEPIFGSMFLYDLHKRRRISETFYFDLNSQKLINLFKRPYTTCKDLTSLSNLCLFRISKRYSICKSENYLYSSTSESTNSLNLKFSHFQNDQIEKNGLNLIFDQNSINESDKNEDFFFEDFVGVTSNVANMQSTTCLSNNNCCKGGIFIVIRVCYIC